MVADEFRGSVTAETDRIGGSKFHKDCVPWFRAFEPAVRDPGDSEAAGTDVTANAFLKPSGGKHRVVGPVAAFDIDDFEARVVDDDGVAGAHDNEERDGNDGHDYCGNNDQGALHHCSVMNHCPCELVIG